MLYCRLLFHNQHTSMKKLEIIFIYLGIMNLSQGKVCSHNKDDLAVGGNGNTSVHVKTCGRSLTAARR
uniref:Uncharacterized protein n=1 Tax=Anguilla anguilla TaxID=7936 RepID=A0A0E9QJ54_ANGAN